MHVRGSVPLLVLQLRRHWTGLVALAVVVALTTGVVLAAIAGARRGATAWDRFADRGHAAQALINPGGWSIDYEQVRALPFVDGVVEIPPYATFDVTEPKTSPPVLSWMIRDGLGSATAEVPVVTRGRAFDPEAPDEVLVSQGLLDQSGLRIGSEIVGRVAGAGPPVRLRIVGVGRQPIQYAVNAIDDPFIVTTPAFYAAHREGFAPQVVFDGVDSTGGTVRLAGGVADIPRLDRAMRELSPDPSLDPPRVTSLVGETDGLRDSLRLEAATVLLLAAIAGLSVTIVLAVLVARRSQRMGTDLRPLTGIGVTRRQITVVVGVALAAAVGTGALAGVGFAIALSPVFPIGLGGVLDPDRGVSVDLPVLGIGAAALLLALLVVGFASAWRASSSATRPVDDRAGSPVTSWWLPLPSISAQLGRFHALSRGRGRRLVPAWVGPAVGVFGLTAGLVLGAALTEAVSNPLRYSAGPSVGVVSVVGGQPVADLTAIRAALDTPTAAGRTDLITATFDVRAGEADLNGTSVPLNDIQPAPRGPDRPILAGRLPERTGEIALGPYAADRLGVGVGDTVLGQNPSNPTQAADLEVVGITLGDWNGGGNSYDQVGLVVPTDFDVLVGDAVTDRYELVVLPPGTDRYAWSAAWESATGLSDSVIVFDDPKAVVNLRRLTGLPAYLVGLMAVLTALSFVAVVTGVLRERRFDRVVLRALGLRPRTSYAAAAWSGALLVAFALVIGTALGLLVGRAAWRATANQLALTYAAPTAATRLVTAGILVAVVALVATLVAAVRPAFSSPRRDASVLRGGE